MLNNETIANSMMNKGYAYFWIGEALLKLNRQTEAYCFLKRAFILWSKISQPKALIVQNELNKIESNLILQNYSDNELEEYCDKWIEN